jgi:plastocyanin
VGGAVTLSACSQGTAADYVAGGPVNPPLSSSPRTRTVSLYLRASDPHGASPFNFDGASAGHMTITVPVGWRVDATCANESTILTHSCAIVDQGTTTLAFNGSAVPNPVRGVKQGSAETFSFVASRVGTYQLVCLVPGHREAGMWDWFQVRSGGVPSIAGVVS